MGYYTSYELEINKGDGSVITNLLAENEDAAYAIGENGESKEESKWYNHEKDLRDFSKKHPDTLFKLIGEGEESGDIWHEYYLDGKMQRCKAELVFDDYDENKLK